MNQSESSPLLKTIIEKPVQKPASTLKLMAIVTLRILGYRKKQVNEKDFERLTGVQVGVACLLALIGFTIIIAMLSIFAAKTMG
jgi:hypothetical protein